MYTGNAAQYLYSSQLPLPWSKLSWYSDVRKQKYIRLHKWTHHLFGYSALLDTFAHTKRLYTCNVTQIDWNISGVSGAVIVCLVEIQNVWIDCIQMQFAAYTKHRSYDCRCQCSYSFSALETKKGRNAINLQIFFLKGFKLWI